MEIKVLARRGVSVREIARQLGCSRNTVKRYLNDPSAVRYGPRSPRPTKLDPFKAYVLERIEAARPHWIPAAVLQRELRARGYGGGVTQLKMLLAPYKRVEQDPLSVSRLRPGSKCRRTSRTSGAGANRCSPSWRHWAAPGELRTVHHR